VKFFTTVHVGAAAGFPAIRLQFQNDAHQREPADHIDLLLSSGTAEEMCALIVDAIKTQRAKPN
jgi:hypothetical protein